jgi:SAM-dependent methyltransferase
MRVTEAVLHQLVLGTGRLAERLAVTSTTSMAAEDEMEAIDLDIFVCPTCGSGLSLARGAEVMTCPGCGRSFGTRLGVVDLVEARAVGSERAFYDEYYSRHTALSQSSDLNALGGAWISADAPWEMRLVWERLGDIAGKTVLLLGNGQSHAELYMLTARPHALIYSDLSPIGLQQLAARFGDTGRVFFAAIDALDLPIRDETVDIVYGFAFVHHLPDLDRFLSEVARVLRPGGRAVFMDNAYSPFWQHIKLFWLRPLMWLSHRREPRSPEDIRDTMAGGLREDVLAERIRAVGGVPWFERVAFLYWFWKRVSVSLFPEFFAFLPRHDLISRAFKAIDLRLSRFNWVQRNMIRLVWGMDKPVIDRSR